MRCSRRTFMRLAAAGTTLTFFQPRLVATPAANGGRVLVVLFLNGGNDAVNTVIPYTDGRYRSLRPTLAVPDSEIAKLDDRNGLHPALAPLLPLYESRRLALVNGVGFASLDRSHFHCRDVWMTADAGDGGHHGTGAMEGRGWLGRYADLYLEPIDSPLTTIALSGQGSLALEAETVVPATITSQDSFAVLSDPRGDPETYAAALRSVYGAPGREGDVEWIRTQGSETFAAVDLVRDLPPASVTVTYPGNALGSAFRLAAQIIEADAGTHAIWISQGGYDTHSLQAGDHERLLGDVAASLAAFQADLDARTLSDRVAVMAWSEFGRRAQQNASAGTDHGKAGSVLLLGDGIEGGTVYGGAWDLGELDAGDLPTAIDFRAVYATLIRDWFGDDPMPVLGGHYENLGFVRRAGGRRRAVR